MGLCFIYERTSEAKVGHVSQVSIVLDDPTESLVVHLGLELPESVPFKIEPDEPFLPPWQPEGFPFYPPGRPCSVSSSHERLYAHWSERSGAERDRVKINCCRMAITHDPGNVFFFLFQKNDVEMNARSGNKGTVMSRGLDHFPFVSSSLPRQNSNRR